MAVAGEDGVMAVMNARHVHVGAKHIIAVPQRNPIVPEARQDAVRSRTGKN